jgi:hypothetical protein
VQLDDVPCTGRTVQPVDVLRDDPVEIAARLQRRDRAMTRIGVRPGDRPPAEMAPGPVPLSPRLASHEVAVRHRGVGPQAPGLAAIVGDA